MGNSHQFTSVLRSREALHSPLELSSTGFLFSRDSPVVDKNLTDMSHVSVSGGGGGGGGHDTAVYLLPPGLDGPYKD